MRRFFYKTKYWIVLFLVLLLLGWYYRLEGAFWFQYSRLKNIDCFAENVSVCKNKIWAHRVNSLERLNLIEPYFPGFEVDVAFDSARQSFLVYHPPFQGRIILLERFMQQLTRFNKKAWIDLRYVSSLNYEKAFLILDNIEKQIHFKHLIIIELYDITAANYFAEKGYTISMNIPAYQLQTSQAWNKFSGSISPKVIYVSQEDAFLPQLKTYFPTKRIILWSVAFKNYFSLNHLEALVNDEKIDVVLVNVKSRYRY